MALSPFINDFPPNPIRNNFTGAAGYDFTVANETTVSHVGRPIGSVFTQSHQINIWDRSTQSLLAQASVSPTDPVIDGYAVTALPNALLLSPGVEYAITSDEYNGGDNWQDFQIVTGLTTGFTVLRQCYSTVGLSAYPNVNGGGGINYKGYVWPNLYSGGTTQSIVPQLLLRRRRLSGGLVI